MKQISWAFLDTENVEDVNWLYEILEINQMCKGMSLVYSTLSVAATKSLESRFLPCTVFLSWILLFICTICLQHLMSLHLLPIISPPYRHTWLVLYWLWNLWGSSSFWLKRTLLLAGLCYFTARSMLYSVCRLVQMKQVIVAGNGWSRCGHPLQYCVCFKSWLWSYVLIHMDATLAR